MTDREVAERLAALAGLADKLRMPGHRRTAEECMAAQDEVRSGLRGLYRELTGQDLPRDPRPAHDTASLRHAGLQVPTALIRDRARRLRARA